MVAVVGCTRECEGVIYDHGLQLFVELLVVLNSHTKHFAMHGAVTMFKSHKDECGAVLVSLVHAMHKCGNDVLKLLLRMWSCVCVTDEQCILKLCSKWSCSLVSIDKGGKPVFLFCPYPWANGLCGELIERTLLCRGSHI